MLTKADSCLQGFGLSFGSDLYLAISKYGRHNLARTAAAESIFLHGSFLSKNMTANVTDLPGSFSFLDTATSNEFVVKGEFLSFPHSHSACMLT